MEIFENKGSQGIINQSHFPSENTNCYNNNLSALNRLNLSELISGFDWKTRRDTEEKLKTHIFN